MPRSQAAIADVFAAFAQTGSAYGVAGAFAGRRFPQRAYGGAWAGQLRWGRLTHPARAGMLRTRPMPGHTCSGGAAPARSCDPDGTVTPRPPSCPAQWEVLIPDHHPGYITWDAVPGQRGRLAANRTNAGARPPREGSRAVSGHRVLRRCGRSMEVRYQERLAPHYECSHSRADHVATPRLRSVRADTIDDVVADALLAAVEPDQVALALAAADEVTDRRRRSVRAAELAVERARYAAERAERAFLACEPENRLVARSLETRWETKLAELAEANAGLAAQPKPSPSCPAPSSWPRRVADLPVLWAAETTSDKDRKRLLRTLLADVTITPSQTDPTQLAVGLRWKSGASQQLAVTRRRNAIQLRTTDPDAIALATRIGPGLDNAALAAALNRAGHRTGTGQPFDGVAAGNLRHYHHIPYPDLLADGELTPRQVADRIDVTVGTIHYWINNGFLPAHRGPANRWCIPFPPEIEAACRHRANDSAHQHRDIDPQPRRDTELSVADAAGRLGVKPDVIYSWAQWGHIPSRRSQAGRLWIDYTPAVEQTCLRANRQLIQAPRRTQNPSRTTPGKDSTMKPPSPRSATGWRRPP